MDSFELSSLCSEETSSWHSAFEPISDKRKTSKSSPSTPGAIERESSKDISSEGVGKSKHKKDTKKGKKSSKRKHKTSKKQSSHSSLQSDSCPAVLKNQTQESCAAFLELGDPMQFHRPLPAGKACAKMLVRAKYRCECHFLLSSKCPSRA